MRYEKEYVVVYAKFIKEGGVRPLEIVWADGKRYVIDKVKFIERAPSRVGGVGVKRFVVIVEGFEKHLYYEKDGERWFVERKVL
jgi:hypothetical protein